MQTRPLLLIKAEEQFERNILQEYMRVGKSA